MTVYKILCGSPDELIEELEDAPTVLTGWHQTPCDLLAEDWEEVE